MKGPADTVRNRRLGWALAAAVLPAAAGLALRSVALISLGLVLVAIAVRFRRQRAAWEYPCFVVLALAGCAWGLSLGSAASTLPGAIPLMLSYVLDHLEERRRKRTSSSAVDTAGGCGPAASIVPSKSELETCSDLSDPADEHSQD